MDAPQIFNLEISGGTPLQGDIFKNVPISIFKNTIIDDEVVKVRQIENRVVSVISQSCDIEDHEIVTISPVYTFAEFIENEKLLSTEMQTISSNLGHLRSQKRIHDKFYLPPIQINDESPPVECYIDLLQVDRIQLPELNKSVRLASLSHWGRHLLNYKLSWIYGRPVIEWKIK